MSGRAFIAFGSSRPDVRLVAVQPFMGELASSPHLATLRRLDLTGNRIGADGARSLAGSPHLGGLRELGLNGNAIGSNGVFGLMGASWLAGVESLGIGDNELSSEDIASLLLLAPTVSALDVSGNRFEPTPLPFTAGVLTRFAAARCGVGPDGVTHYLGRGRNALLETIDLRHNELGSRGVEALQSHPFPALTNLNLGFTDCGDYFDAAAFPALRTLSLRACRLVRPVLRSATVETLDLSVNPLANPAAAVVGCPNLVHLGLANTGLTDAALVSVLAALPQLRSLDLAWNPLNAATVAALVARQGLDGRLSIDLTGTRGRPAAGSR
jgi:hypothetical protein